ncbi:hypothetical protein [Candidatus Poriferisodalis sp.]|uniref:hypothetical protein n=1 Tax=Candidatus Poriferisodalis sp. TaxID=3101277 RepID=UPI003B023EB9
MTRLRTKRHSKAAWLGAMALILGIGALTPTLPAGAHEPDAYLEGASRWFDSDCSGQVPIVVASDAAAQSDIYSAVTLAGVIGSDCVVLVGPRDAAIPAAQLRRFRQTTEPGYVVGGKHAVGSDKTRSLDGRSMTRLAGGTRWETALQVGEHAKLTTIDRNRSPEELLLSGIGPTRGLDVVLTPGTWEISLTLRDAAGDPVPNSWRDAEVSLFQGIDDRCMFFEDSFNSTRPDWAHAANNSALSDTFRVNPAHDPSSGCEAGPTSVDIGRVGGEWKWQMEFRRVR